MVQCTLLHQPLPLVLVKHFCRLALDRLIAVRLRFGHLHSLAVHLETIHLLNRIQTGLLAIEYDKGLALALQAALRYNVEDRAVVLEDDSEGFLEGIDLDALFEVVDL
jgi:hypothetical protein